MIFENTQNITAAYGARISHFEVLSVSYKHHIRITVSALALSRDISAGMCSQDAVQKFFGYDYTDFTLPKESL